MRGRVVRMARCLTRSFVRGPVVQGVRCFRRRVVSDGRLGSDDALFRGRIRIVPVGMFLAKFDTTTALPYYQQAFWRQISGRGSAW